MVEVQARGVLQGTPLPGNIPPDPVTEQRERPGPRAFLASPVLWGFVGALTLSCIYTRSALLNLTTGALGGANDAYQNIWNNYWLKTALFDLHQDPFYTAYIYYPTGTSLRFHTFNPLNGLLTMPLNLTIGYVTAFNLLFIFAFCLTGFFSFLLFRYLVGDPWASFAGAAVATYCNFRVLDFLSLGQSNMVSEEWLPLYILLVLHALNGPRTWIRKGWQWECQQNQKQAENRNWPVYAVLAVAMLVFMSFTDWQYLLYAVCATALYFVFLLFTAHSWRERRSTFLKLAALGGTYAVIITPTVLLPMLQEAAQSPWLNIGYQSVQHSLDFAALLGPGLENPGYLTFGVALFGLWSAWRRGYRDRNMALFWAITALIFYTIALGPQLIMNDKVTDVALPYALIQNVPVLSIGRDPGRFAIISLLGLGTLVAFGLRSIFAAVLAWWQVRARKPGKFVHRVLPLGVTVLFLFVTLGGFMAAAGQATTVPPDWPDFYKQIAQDRQQYAILELPLFSDEGAGADRYMAYQLIHQKPRFSGKLARDRKLTNPNNFVKHATFFRKLWMLNSSEQLQQQAYPEHDIVQRTDDKVQGIPILNYYNVRYVILYKDAISETNWPKYEGAVKRILGENSAPVYDDKILRAYEVPRASAPADPLSLDLGYGWYSSETRSDGVVYRFADRVNHELAGQPNDVPCQILAMNVSNQAVRATLTFTAYAYKQSRTLIVAINGQQLASLQLLPSDPKQFSISVTVPPGNNIITLASPEAPLPTDDPKADARLLSFAVYSLRLNGEH